MPESQRQRKRHGSASAARPSQPRPKSAKPARATAEPTGRAAAGSKRNAGKSVAKRDEPQPSARATTDSKRPSSRSVAAAKPRGSQTRGVVRAPPAVARPVHIPAGERQATPVAAAAPAAPVAVRIETVDAEHAGQRLDNFLSSRLKGVPRSALYRALRTGQVRVNGGRCKPERKLEAGDLVRIPPMRVDTPETPPAPSQGLREGLAERLLYEDRELLVLNKPSGLASHGGSGISLGAIEALRAMRPTESLELVHRLDRDTSGILLLARRHSALRRLQALIREHRMRKKYLALLQGLPQRDHFEVDAALAKNQMRGGERMVTVDAAGKESLSRFRVLQRYRNACLVEVEIVTGRTHQIRVHARHAGHPVAGDEKYGDAEFNRQLRTLGLKRLFLHAHALAFPWGEQGETIQFAAPLDAQLRALLDVLARADG